MRNRHVGNQRAALPWAIALAGAASLAGEARADDLKVPRKYRTIEAAQAVAQPGDRIVVTKGRHVGVVVHADGVTVVGRGSARLVGDVRVSGAGSAVEGFKVEGVVTLEGDGNRAEGLRLRRGSAILAQGGAGTVVRGNRAQGPAEIEVRTDGAVVEGNEFPRGTVLVEGHGATVEGNQADFFTVQGAGADVLANEAGGAGMQVLGDGALVQGNDVREGLIYLSGQESSLVANDARGVWAADADGFVAQDNALGGWGLEVNGDGAIVEGNEIRREAGYYGPGITIAGDDARVVGNDVEAPSIAIDTWGAGADVSGNRVVAGSPDVWNAGTPAVIADLDGGVAVIEGNEVRHVGTGGIFVNGSGATISTNDVLGQGDGPGNGIQVIGDSALVTGNDCDVAAGSGGTACGIVIDGSGSLVTDNFVTGSATDGIEIWHGSGNVVSDCIVFGVGRCGVWVQNQATATVVTDVDSSVSLVGFMNLADGTELSDSTLTGNRCMDVISATTLLNLSTCTYVTFTSDVNIDPVLGGGD